MAGGDLSQLSLCAASAVASADLLMLDKPPTGSHGVSALQATLWKRQKVPCHLDLFVDIITARQSELPTLGLCVRGIAEDLWYRRYRSVQADFHT